MICKTCLTDKPLEDFPKRERRCKNCRDIYYREWYKTNGRKRPLNYLNVGATWVKDNPEKNRAKSMVSWALKVGKITKPDFCSICKEKRRLVGHHIDYKDQLGVLWLCSSCHKKVHNGTINLKVMT